MSFQRKRRHQAESAVLAQIVSSISTSSVSTKLKRDIRTLEKKVSKLEDLRDSLILERKKEASDLAETKKTIAELQYQTLKQTLGPEQVSAREELDEMSTDTDSQPQHPTFNTLTRSMAQKRINSQNALTIKPLDTQSDKSKKTSQIELVVHEKNSWFKGLLLFVILFIVFGLWCGITYTHVLNNEAEHLDIDTGRKCEVLRQGGVADKDCEDSFRYLRSTTFQRVFQEVEHQLQLLMIGVGLLYLFIWDLFVGRDLFGRIMIVIVLCVILFGCLIYKIFTFNAQQMKTSNNTAAFMSSSLHEMIRMIRNRPLRDE